MVPAEDLNRCSVGALVISVRIFAVSHWFILFIDLCNSWGFYLITAIKSGTTCFIIVHWLQQFLLLFGIY